MSFQQQPPKRQVYFSLPYYNKENTDRAKMLTQKLSYFFSHLDIRISLKDSFTISNLFKYEDKLNYLPRASLIIFTNLHVEAVKLPT